MAYTFNFEFRLMCEEYASPHLAGSDQQGAMETAQAALMPMWNHQRANPLDFARDIAPRIQLVVGFIGFDRLDASPDQCAQYMAAVTSDDLALLRDLRLYAAYEWNDGNVEEYSIHEVVDETDADLARIHYANCAACGFTTDRAVEREGRFLCVPCDDHENEASDD